MKKILLLVFSSLLSLSLYAQVDLQLGLVGFWQLDNNGIDSLGLHNGTVVGAQPTVDRFGMSDHALVFTPNSNTTVNIGDNFDNAFANANQGFCISAWIKPNSLNSNGVIAAKCADSGCGLNERQFFFRLYPNGRLNFTFYSTLATGNYRNISGTTVISDTSQWYHVAVTYDPTANNGLDRVKLYVNGEPEATTLVQTAGNLGQIQNGPASFSIGAYVSSQQNICYSLGNFDGAIDDVRLYDRILSPLEVYALYYPYFLQDGLMARWDLDNNGLDSIGLHNGNMVGATPTVDRCGVSNAALSFSPNSNTYVNIGDQFDNVFTNTTSGFSLAAWIKPNGILSNNIIMAKDADIACNMDEREFFFRLYPAGRLNFSYYMTLAAYDDRLISGNSVLSDTSQWYFVVATYDPTLSGQNGLDRVKLYVNALQETTSMVSAQGPLGHIPNGPAPLCIGAYLSSLQTICTQIGNFDGDIDEARLYSKVLSQAEVDALYYFDCPIVGTNQIAESPLKIYPNPTSDYLTIEGNAHQGIVGVSVYNSIGQLFTTQTLSGGGSQIDLRNAPAGMYYVRLDWQNGQSQISKIIKLP